MHTSEIKKIVDIPILWENLTLLEKRLVEVATSKDPYLTEIAQHLISAGGKRFPPLVPLLGGEVAKKS